MLRFLANKSVLKRKGKKTANTSSKLRLKSQMQSSLCKHPEKLELICCYSTSPYLLRNSPVSQMQSNLRKQPEKLKLMTCNQTNPCFFFPNQKQKFYQTKTKYNTPRGTPLVLQLFFYYQNWIKNQPMLIKKSNAISTDTAQTYCQS